MPPSRENGGQQPAPEPSLACRLAETLVVTCPYHPDRQWIDSYVLSAAGVDETMTQRVQALDDSLAADRRELGDDHPATLQSAADLAVVFAELGDVPEARALGEDTLARQQAIGDHFFALAATEEILQRLDELEEDRE